MNKNRLLGIFILFVLLITCAGVSFAASDIDNSFIGDSDIDDGYIDDGLDIDDDSDMDDDYEDDSDDEDWDDEWDDDYEDDSDDEDWDDEWDDDYEDDLDDEDWDDDWDDDWGVEYWHDVYYDGLDNATFRFYYVAKSGISYKASSADYNESCDENESYENETYFMANHSFLASGFADSIYRPASIYQGSEKSVKNTDLFNDAIASFGDDQNTSVSSEIPNMAKNIEVGENNNFLAMLLVLIISILLIL